MQSIIIVAEKNQALSLIETDSDMFPRINPLDLLMLEPELSIGIDAIRVGQAFLATPPLKSPKKRIVVVEAHTMTIEAQNSMLKMLEEPQEYAQIILATPSLDSLLPTVQSRCQIIQQAVQPLAADAQAIELAHALDQASVSEKITLAQTEAKSRQEAKAVIKRLLLAQQAALSAKVEGKQVNRMEALFVALTQLDANTNHRMVLEHVFFNW